MVEIRTSKTGSPVPFWDGRPLHSVYDPEREARRYVESQLGGSRPGVVILLGAAQGYVENEIRRRWPDVKLISVYFSHQLQAQTAAAANMAWSPQCGRTLTDYLMDLIDESDLRSLSVLEWAPAARIFQSKARRARQQLSRLTERLKANFFTTASLGKLWLRNSLTNFVSLPRQIRNLEIDPGRPLLIAGSGPTLEQSAGAIARIRSQCDLWTLPSALEPLLSRGITPDLVIQTDPGTFASWHLHPARGREIPVLMPLSAARGVWRSTHAVCLIQQPYRFEGSLVSLLELESVPRIAPQGTVAATAFRLAGALGYETTVLVGLDFGYRDIQSHARPGLFDQYHQSGEDRTSPNHSWLCAQAWERTTMHPGGYRSSSALEAYGDWFDGTQQPRRDVYRLNPSPRAIRSAIPLGNSELIDMIGAKRGGGGSAFGLRPQTIPSSRALRNKALGQIRQWRKAIEAIQSNDPRSWDPVSAELCHFVDLPAFSALKREPNSAGKAVVVGTVDEFLLRLARRFEEEP